LSTTADTVCIAGVGYAVPANVRAKSEILKAFPHRTEEEMVRLTGIRERRYAAEDEPATDLAKIAVQHALNQAGMDVGQIDGIIMATIIPDQPVPSMASALARDLGIPRALAFDLNAACSGWLYALEVGRSLIRCGTAKNVAVVTAELLSRITNPECHDTAVLFGDGAGAAILRHRDSGSHGVISTHIASDGNFADILWMPGGGSRHPIRENNVNNQLQTVKMSGKEVYKQAVTAMVNAARIALDKAGLTIDDIACVIPHQANLRIIEAIADRLKVPVEKVYVNLDRYGNTSAAAVAIALDEANRTGRIKPGDYVLMVVFGGGLTWAGSVVEW